MTLGDDAQQSAILMQYEGRFISFLFLFTTNLAHQPSNLDLLLSSLVFVFLARTLLGEASSGNLCGVLLSGILNTQVCQSTEFLRSSVNTCVCWWETMKFNIQESKQEIIHKKVCRLILRLDTLDTLSHAYTGQGLQLSFTLKIRLEDAWPLRSWGHWFHD